MTYSDTLLTVEHQTIVHTQHEHRNTSSSCRTRATDWETLLFCQKPTQTSSTAT